MYFIWWRETHKHTQTLHTFIIFYIRRENDKYLTLSVTVRWCLPQENDRFFHPNMERHQSGLCWQLDDTAGCVHSELSRWWLAAGWFCRLTLEFSLLVSRDSLAALLTYLLCRLLAQPLTHPLTSCPILLLPLLSSYLTHYLINKIIYISKALIPSL